MTESLLPEHRAASGFHLDGDLSAVLDPKARRAPRSGLSVFWSFWSALAERDLAVMGMIEVIGLVAGGSSLGRGWLSGCWAKWELRGVGLVGLNGVTEPVSVTAVEAELAEQLGHEKYQPVG
ncbi:MAG: hypothetical protein Q4B08_13635, partial [Propionibacteriaceae bacterium]|nr:hypothetical protein [Propionibacteriaceae bacterium]